MRAVVLSCLLLGCPNQVDPLGDSGSVDTGAPDGSGDSGVVDTGTGDTGTLDTGTLDTGTLDTGASDTGSPVAVGRSGHVATLLGDGRVVVLALI